MSVTFMLDNINRSSGEAIELPTVTETMDCSYCNRAGGYWFVWSTDEEGKPIKEYHVDPRVNKNAIWEECPDCKGSGKLSFTFGKYDVNMGASNAMKVCMAMGQDISTFNDNYGVDIDFDQMGDYLDHLNKLPRRGSDWHIDKVAELLEFAIKNNLAVGCW